MYLVNALNALRSNVWCVMILGLGVVLTLRGHEQIGSNLILGAFAVIRGDSQSPNVPTPPDAAKK